MPKPDPHAPWWTTTDVAAYLGVAPATVRAYRKRGEMPAPDYPTKGRQIEGKPLWKPTTIVEWHKNRPGHGGRPPRPR